MQFAEQGIFRRLAVFDAALWKLPSLLPDTLSPQDLSATTDEDDAHIGAVTIPVDHVRVKLRRFVLILPHAARLNNANSPKSLRKDAPSLKMAA
jgi:hypothetical protein